MIKMILAIIGLILSITILTFGIIYSPHLIISILIYLNSCIFLLIFLAIDYILIESKRYLR